jgi:general secretion pathway protein E
VRFARPRVDLPGRSTGYRGRGGVYEVVLVDETLRALIHAGASEAELTRAARQHTPSILDDGWAKVSAGLTSADEVLRVTRED